MNTEFVKQTLRENLSRVLIPHVADGLWSIYENAKQLCLKNGQSEQTLRTFQNLLSRVPEWKEETLRKEVERIEKASKCEYIDDLIMGVFISYIRAFASLQQVEETHVEIPFERPSTEKFIHQLYKFAARSAWKTAYLFKTIGVPAEQQARNRRDIETILAQNLNEVIDSFIPWKSISAAYFRAKSSANSAPEENPLKPHASGISFSNEVEEKEITDDESEEEEEEDDVPPKVMLGETMENVDLGVADMNDENEDDDTKSLDLEAMATGTVSLAV